MQTKKQKNKKTLQKILTIPTAIIASGIIVGIASHSTLLAERSVQVKAKAGKMKLLINDTSDNTVNVFKDHRSIKNMKSGSEGEECIKVTAASSHEGSKIITEIEDNTTELSPQDTIAREDLEKNIQVTATVGTQQEFQKNCTNFIPDRENNNTKTQEGPLSDLRKLDPTKSDILKVDVPADKNDITKIYKFKYKASNITDKHSEVESDIKVKFTLKDE